MIKKLLMLFASIVLCLPIFAKTNMCVVKTSGDTVKYDIDEVREVVYEEEESTDSNVVDGHEYVDFGLPSGLKWATMNIGATNPEEYGTYFSWGESTPKDEYYHGNSLTFDKEFSELAEAGMIDANGNLTPEYDAATQNWGEKWRIPTKAEFNELIKNCTWTWTSLGGVEGYKVASKKDNTKWIFLPAAGYRYGTSSSNVGSNGYYWSSTVNESSSDSAYYLYFNSSSKDTGNNLRNYGLSVRPVTE